MHVACLASGVFFDILIIVLWVLLLIISSVVNFLFSIIVCIFPLRLKRRKVFVIKMGGLDCRGGLGRAVSGSRGSTCFSAVVGRCNVKIAG